MPYWFHVPLMGTAASSLQTLSTITAFHFPLPSHASPMGHSEAEKVVRNSANPVDVDSLAEVAVEADWVSELVVVGMTVEIVRAGVTSQTRKVVFGLLAFVDSATPYLPSHEQYEDELVLLDEVEIAVAVVAEADVVTAGAVADAVMVVPLVMTRSRLVYSGFNQDATDAAVDAMASSEPSSNAHS
ncbi:uncharacterized protein TrAFT101_000067 [Trichoderma asperellum]|uniref:uncharacterized protein n=1 Tax=Trichoderma asperellum TaxID=101201 RepID=UPI00332E43AD|nr:hypothetical protein TrAFT101_000067 [Trichoderma asperellum]